MRKPVSFMLFSELSNSENTTWIFTVWDYFFLLYLMNSRLKVLPKLILLTFQDRTADVTYYADLMLFLQVMSGSLSLTVAFFVCQFLAFY